MKYALLVYAEPSSHDLPEDQVAGVLAEYEALRDEPGYLASGQLHARVHGQRILHAGHGHRPP